MARIAKSFSAEFVQSFEDKLFSTYPEIKTDGLLNRKQIVSTMRVLGTEEYPMWLLQEKNRKGRGVYKLAAYVAPVVKTPKVKENKTLKQKLAGPSENSQRWASGMAPKKKVKARSDLTGAYDNSVEFDDVMSLRGEFGLGEFRNSMDY